MTKRELTEKITEQVADKSKNAAAVDEKQPELAGRLRQQCVGQLDLAESLGLDVEKIKDDAIKELRRYTRNVLGK